ncbi:MAG: winged helix-turn-helix transcriptional regulator [Treponema sp.]|nr:winged helix-turn-helix transcriptional regulator [Treponema sp.]
MIDKEQLERATQQFQACSALFVALGDTTRQKLCLDLAEAADEGINVAQLSGKSILSRPAISHHLKVLKDAKIVEPVKKGTQIFYRLRLKEVFQDVKSLIDTVETIIESEEDAGTKTTVGD